MLEEWPPIVRPYCDFFKQFKQSPQLTLSGLETPFNNEQKKMKQIYYKIIDIYNLVLSLKPKRWTRSQSHSQNSLLAIKSSGNYFVYEQKCRKSNYTRLTGKRADRTVYQVDTIDRPVLQSQSTFLNEHFLFTIRLSLVG